MHSRTPNNWTSLQRTLWGALGFRGTLVGNHWFNLTLKQVPVGYFVAKLQGGNEDQ